MKNEEEKISRKFISNAEIAFEIEDQYQGMVVAPELERQQVESWEKMLAYSD